MSYLPFRDNPDLAGIGDAARDRILELSEEIDLSSRKGLHADQCGCASAPKCGPWNDLHSAYSYEVVGWLYAKGLLTLPRNEPPTHRFDPDEPCGCKPSDLCSCDGHPLKGCSCYRFLLQPAGGAS